MQDGKDRLVTLQPRHRHLVGVDSDGCVFDSMEIKQKKCFIPLTIEIWGLEAIAEYERETHEFVNLYSKWRGSNRFPALVKVFELLAERDDVKKLGFELPDLLPLRSWIDSGEALGEPALERAVAQTRDPILIRALRWSRAINEAVVRVAPEVQPFPFARESLARLQGVADVVCISATPHEALEREWRNAGLDRHVAAIAGQEMGSKASQLRIVAEGRELPSKVLMVGDALGDLQAAHEAGVRFYPIMPAQEGKSWLRFYESIIDQFLEDGYAAEFESGLVAEFEAALPDRPPWHHPVGPTS
jgi:phosphoglycolate phosphatase-like HAD superfamily hydrolase